MGLYSIIPGFCGAPWAVGAPRIVTTFHPTSDGPAPVYQSRTLGTHYMIHKLRSQGSDPFV